MGTDFMDPTNGPDDIRGELALNMMPHPNILQKLLIGWSSVYMSSAQYYLDYELYLRNINESGTALGFQFHSVGVDYRLPFEELEFIALNMFDKKIFDGTVDIGLEVAQPLSRDTTMRIKTDWVGDSQWRMGTNVPGASFTQELSFDQKLAKDLTLNAFYRYFYVPSRLNSYLIEVPDYSDLLGLALLYRF